MDQFSGRVIFGALAGFIATAPMSAVMLAWHRRLPTNQRDPLPPEQITLNALDAAGLDNDLSRSQTAALTVFNHFAYGAATGSLYGGLTGTCPPASPLISGVAYGLGVWGVSYLGLLPILGLYRAATKEPAERNWLMLTAHIVWGGSLGVLTEIGRPRPRCVDVA